MNNTESRLPDYSGIGEYIITGQRAEEAGDAIAAAWALIDHAPRECYYPEDYGEAARSIAARYECEIRWTV